MTDFEPHVFRMNERPCPLCGKTLDAAGPFEEVLEPSTPQPGDWTICAGCLQWLIFEPNMTLRVITNAEWLALSPHERVELTQQLERVRRAWEHRP